MVLPPHLRVARARHRRAAGPAPQAARRGRRRGVSGILELISAESGLEGLLISAAGDVLVEPGTTVVPQLVHVITRESLRTAGQPERRVDIAARATASSRSAATPRCRWMTGTWSSRATRATGRRSGATWPAAPRGCSARNGSGSAEAREPLRQLGQELAQLAAREGPVAEIVARLRPVGLSAVDGLRVVVLTVEGNNRADPRAAGPDRRPAGHEAAARSRTAGRARGRHHRRAAERRGRGGAAEPRG